jgi:hypothetical protein
LCNTIESLGKRGLEQSGKYPVNENDEEFFGLRHNGTTTMANGEQIRHGRGTGDGLLLSQRSLDRQQCFLEYRQIVLRGVPDNLTVNPLILVAQDVSDTGDVSPTHLFVLRFVFTANMAASLGNHLKPSLES